MRYTRFLTIVLAGVALVFGLAVGTGQASSPAAPVDGPNLLYVTNQGEASVAIIDMESLELVETVDLQPLGFSERAQPHHAIAEPDGSAWYVSLIGENVVLKFNDQNELVGQVELEVPGLLAIHPTEDLLLVARSMMAVNPPSSLGFVSRSDMQVVDEIDVFFSRPHAVTITADGRFVYSASLATNHLMGVDSETFRGEITTLDGDTQVIIQLAASPTGTELVGTGQLTGQLLFFERDEVGVLSVTDIVAVGHQPWHPIFSPDGEFVYVPNKQSNDVSVVDVASREVVDTIEHEAFVQPHGSALSPDGRYLFISNNHNRPMMEMMAQDMARGAEAPPRDHDGDHGSPGHMDHDDAHHSEHHGAHNDHEHGHEDTRGTVAVIDTETREVVKVIEVGNYPTGMGTRAW